MMCESSGNPSAVNGTSVGLMQVNAPYHLAQLEAVTGSRNPLLLFVPAVNIAVAHLIWQGQGWFPWSCKP